MTAFDYAALGLQITAQVVLWWVISRRPHHSWAWWSVGVGMSAFALAHALARRTGVTFSTTSPTINVVATLGYCAVTAGLLGMIRPPTRDPSTPTDRLIRASELTAVLSAIGVLAWQISTIPGLGEQRVDHADVIGYLASDLFLGLILARLVMINRHNVTAWLLVAGVLSSWVGDLTYLVGADPSLSQVWYFLAYPILMAAVVHPDMVALAQRKATAPDATGSIWLLAPAALALLGVMAISVTNDEPITVGALVGCTVSVVAAGVRVRILVSQIRASAVELTRRAIDDDLTGLPNRRHLVERLREIVATPVLPAVLVFIDLDDFKAVNDRYGHATGDDVLAVVGARLAAVVGHDDLAARYAGDEFVVVCQGTASDDHDDLAGRIADAIRMPMPTRSGDLVVSASVGIVEITGMDSADHLLEIADQAMYRAKTTRP